MKNLLFILSCLFILQGAMATTATEDSLSVDTKLHEPENRNTVIIGFMIGGHNLLGVDYEIRMHDYVGIHFGAGLPGYTAGLKLHTKPHKSSPFFNINFKDMGFGYFQTAGVEYGATWVFNKEKSDFGLHFQVGVGAVTKASDEYKETLGDEKVPESTLTFGIGLAW